MGDLLLTDAVLVGELVSASHLVFSSSFFDELSTESSMLARQRSPVAPPDISAVSIGYSG
jgi:hypothetical protein